MVAVNDVFSRGPDAINDWLEHASHKLPSDELDLKQLADICWTRASTLEKSQPAEAKKWALASLAGYELISERGSTFVAESARENAEALRSWDLLSN